MSQSITIKASVFNMKLESEAPWQFKMTAECEDADEVARCLCGTDEGKEAVFGVLTHTDILDNVDTNELLLAIGKERIIKWLEEEGA